MTRVLIVEDHISLRAMLAELIKQANGLELCGESESAEAALEFFGNSQPELVLIDVSLPGKSGIELTEILVERWPGTLCVILTGRRASNYVELARVAGAKAYVEKTQVQQLVSILRQVVGGESLFP